MFREALRLAVAVLAQLDGEEAEPATKERQSHKRSRHSGEQARVRSWRPDAAPNWLFVEQTDGE